MSEFLVVMGLAALPALANFLGGGLAEVFRVSARSLSLALHLALRQAPELVTLSVLALTGGALSAVVVEEMVTEAHEGDTSSIGPVFLTAGFALFAAISVYVG